MFYGEMTKEDVTDELIREEMHKTRERVFDLLKSCKMHVLYNEEIALMIAQGFFEDFEPACIIAKDLNLYKIDLLAVLEDFDSFADEFIEQLEQQVDFEYL